MTYKEIVYSILNEIKLFSDDADFTPEHIIYLVNKYKLYILKQYYEKRKDQPGDANYQELCLDLEEVEAIDGMPCTGGTYLRTTEKIPTSSNIGTLQVYIEDFFQSRIVYVSPERMRHSGVSKWTKNIIYASVAPDRYLYLKSYNPQYKYLEKIHVRAIFDDPEEAYDLQCDKDEVCDILDMEFPAESFLVPLIQDAVIKEIQQAVYRPTDVINNGYNDMSDQQAANYNLNRQQEQLARQQQQPQYSENG